MHVCRIHAHIVFPTSYSQRTNVHEEFSNKSPLREYQSTIFFFYLSFIPLKDLMKVYLNVFHSEQQLERLLVTMAS